MYFEYFIKTSEQLWQTKRFREHIDLCEKAIPVAYFRQYKVLCMWTLADSYYFHVGNAELAREKHIELLELFDSDKSVIYEDPTRQEVMEDMYVKSCSTMSDLAISYEEYEKYMHKIEEVRPHTELQKNQMKLVEGLKAEGRDWAYNISALAMKGAGNDDIFAQTAAQWSLLLLYRRQLRVSREEINRAIAEYTMCILRLVESAMDFCKQKNHPCNAYNYLFILENALRILQDFKQDMATRDESEESVKALSLLKERLENIASQFEREGYSYTAPYGTDYVSPVKLKKDIEQQLAIDHNAINQPPLPYLAPAGKEEQVKAVVSALGYLLLSGVCGYVGLNGEKGPVWKVVMIGLGVIFALASLITFLTRKYTKKK